MQRPSYLRDGHRLDDPRPRVRRKPRGVCSQNAYVSSRGGCQNRWHSLVNCDQGRLKT
jgi:hypothetical protein|eukprot:COSAG01_NODE_7211_length_3304_cov_2.301404_2_plen_58_part_00